MKPTSAQRSAIGAILHGPTAVGGVDAPIIQPKLTLGASGDRYEQEADRVARQVVSHLNALTSQSQSVQRQDGLERENKTGLPDNLKAGIENLSSLAMDDVRVHYNSSKPAELQALAYTQGTEIHVGPGQETHLPHEAWHVVQQKQGGVRPTLQMKDGVAIDDDAGLEKEADVMGTKALQMRRPDHIATDSAAQTATAVQRAGEMRDASEVAGAAIGSSVEKVRLNFLSTSEQPISLSKNGHNLQRETRAGVTVDANVEQSIQQARSGGQPLDSSLSEMMGQRLGADFSNVRIHTGRQADDLNQALQARAFTTGQDIFFRRGEYHPGSQQGQALIAHELVHVVQQIGGNVDSNSLVQRKMGFEFETGNTFYWRNKNSWYKPGRTKDDPMYCGNGFSIEGDTLSTPEVIIDAENQWANISQAIWAAVGVLESVNGKNPTSPQNKRILNQNDDQNWKKETAFDAEIDRNWEADAQATQGVSLANLPKYLEDHLSQKESTVHDTRLKTFAHSLSADVRGFLDLVIQFVADFQKWKGIDNEEGPKNAQAYMARNPYSKMFGAMGSVDQAQFKAMFFPPPSNQWTDNNPITMATGVRGADLVIPNKYLGVDKKKVEEPTILKDWIQQMTTHVADADQLSPPTGWRGGDYGMGFMDVDTASVIGTPLVLLEYRQTDNREKNKSSGKNLNMYSWEEFAEEQYQAAQKYDPNLQ